jgi:predicted lipoprotein with Yx(FWY)xxD motif
VAAALALSLFVSVASFAQYQPLAANGVTTRKVGGQLVYVDAQGMTLYTYDRDSTFKSGCNGQCAKSWPPLVARSEHNHGSWAMMTRSDGSKQWAYRGKPVYTFTGDKAPGDAKGDNAGPKGTHLWHALKVVQ